MECPICTNTHSLTASEGNKGSYCSQCDGIWFSKETLIALCKAHDYDPSIVNIHLSEERRRHITKDCPVCKVSLFTSSVSEVELDWCESCHGVWFDRGEYHSVVTNSPVVSALDGANTAFTVADLIVRVVRALP